MNRIFTGYILGSEVGPVAALIGFMMIAVGVFGIVAVAKHSRDHGPPRGG